MSVAPIMQVANTFAIILLAHMSATVTWATGWKKTGSIAVVR